MIGIDEVGRGAWAGPLLVVAYRQLNDLPNGVGDSKSLTKKRREALASELQLYGDCGFGWVTSQEIDTVGLSAAMRLAVERALAAIEARAEERIVIDGHINFCPVYFTNVQVVIKADGSVPAVSAASIVAKVTRDQHMVSLATIYPEYGFERHVGYGTKAHLQAMKLRGLTAEHRQSFAPVRQLFNQPL